MKHDSFMNALTKLIDSKIQQGISTTLLSRTSDTSATSYNIQIGSVNYSGDASSSVLLNYSSVYTNKPMVTTGIEYTDEDSWEIDTPVISFYHNIIDSKYAGLIVYVSRTNSDSLTFNINAHVIGT